MEEEKATIWESLSERAETYARTNIELAKLKATDKVSDVVSTIVLKIVYVFLALLIILMLNFGLALYISEWMGASYSGFFIVALFYIVVGCLVFAFRKSWVTSPIKDAVITNILDKKDERP